MAFAEAERSTLREFCYFLFRHSHGGSGCGSAHKPIPDVRALISSSSRITSPGAFFWYYLHTPPKQLCHAGVHVHASSSLLPERIVQEFCESDTGFGQLVIDHGHIGSVIRFPQLEILR